MRKLGQATRLIGIFLILICFVIAFLYQSLGLSRYDFYWKDAPMPTELHPIVAKNTEILVESAKEIGISIVITESIRSLERQETLYEQGRTSEGSIVTYAKAGESFHNYGLAIDFAIEDSKGNLAWDITYDGNKNNVPDWNEVASIAKELGFEWGGDWRGFQDYPHLQMTFGLSIHQLQLGFRPKKEML
ncbi:M15 family metallopeptidase [Ornithinibacillus sp. 179-J 7C1 HS]|uniref:M15 family metallopeptidase n=1 Tax=Ornithinibacillus sp. 179-J 7C1 HS TaxID=3142384 RepID=UPI0039A1B403